VVNKIRGVFNILAVKAPGFGDRRKELLQDIAIVCGADFISEDIGRKLESVDVSSLGQAHKVIANKDNTVIVGGKGEKGEIEKRISQIKTQIKETTSEFDKEKFKERLGKLSGGVAVIKVGAPTESAQKELKQRVEDAVAATRAAMEEGIVPGGGIALFNIYLARKSAEKQGAPAAIAAASILKRALEAPLSAIITNSGESPSAIIKELEALKKQESKDGNWFGFDAINNKTANLKEVGIIDPLKVVKTAFINAISVASTYLTVGAAVTDLPEKKEKNSHHGRGQMGEEY